VGLLVGGFGDGGLDAASAQVSPDGLAGVGLVGQHPVRAGAWPAAAGPVDGDAGHHLLEGHRVVPLPGGDHPGDRAAPAVRGQVQLGVQPTTGPAQPLPVRVAAIPDRIGRIVGGIGGGILVIRLSPP